MKKDLVMRVHRRRRESSLAHHLPGRGQAPLKSSSTGIHSVPVLPDGGTPIVRKRARSPSLFHLGAEASTVPVRTHLCRNSCAGLNVRLLLIFFAVTVANWACVMAAWQWYDSFLREQSQGVTNTNTSGVIQLSARHDDQLNSTTVGTFSQPPAVESESLITEARNARRINDLRARLKEDPYRGASRGSLRAGRMTFLDQFDALPVQQSLFVDGFSHLSYRDAMEQHSVLFSDGLHEVVSQRAKSFRSIYTSSNRGIQLQPTAFNVSLDTAKRGDTWREGSIPRPTALLETYYASEAQRHEYQPEVYHSAAVGSASFCDPSDADFTVVQDRACERYLHNPANWVALKPLSSSLASGRTIKFMLSFRHHNVTAILKVPQVGFLLESVSEVAGYHVDRLLGFRRVPPTVLVWFPIDFLRAAAATLGNAYYVQWTEADAFRAEVTAKAREPCRDSRLRRHWANLQVPLTSRATAAPEVRVPECILASIQLWMHDVDPIEDTLLSGTSVMFSELYTLQHPSTISHTLRRRTLPAKKKVVLHGRVEAMGAREKPARQPPAIEVFRTLVTTYRGVPLNLSEAQVLEEAVHRRLYPASIQLSSQARNYIAMTEYFDLMVFDTIVANGDRREGSNLFALAACAPLYPCDINRLAHLVDYLRLSETKDCFQTTSNMDLGTARHTPWSLVATPPSRSGLRLVYLDQGSAFYITGLLRESPFASTALTNASSRHLCLQRFRTVARLELIALYALGRLQAAAAEEQERNITLVDTGQLYSSYKWNLAQEVTGPAAILEASAVASALYTLLSYRLPPGLSLILHHSLLKAACRRVWSVLAHRSHCATLFSPEEMYF